MPRHNEYPAWVQNQLKPGMYVNKQGDNYYIYEATSERRAGVKHPVRVYEGYVGKAQKPKAKPKKKGKKK